MSVSGFLFCPVALSLWACCIAHEFMLGSLAVCFMFRLFFIEFPAVIAYLSFQMNFTISLVISRGKHKPHITVLDHIKFRGKFLHVKGYGMSFICSCLLLYLLEGYSHRFFIFLKLVPRLYIYNIIYIILYI